MKKSNLPLLSTHLCLLFLQMGLAFPLMSRSISPGRHEVPPKPSGSAVTEVIHHIPINATFYNECCQEWVQITGTASLVTNNNIIHVVVSDIAGTGLSTNTVYEAKGNAVETNVFYSNPVEGIFTFKLNLTNDSGCSFKIKVTFQAHANANGDITAEVMHIEVKC